MSDGHPIRNGIIATVVGGVILAALGVLWSPAKRLLAWFGSVLGSGVTLPVWAFVVGIAALVFGAAVLKKLRAPAEEPRRRLRAQTTETADSLAEGPPATQIGIHPLQTGPHVVPEPEGPDGLVRVSGLEVDVLKRIAKEDDAPMYVDTLKRSVGISNLRLQTVLDRLTAIDLVEVEDEQEDEEPVVFLTARGRQFVLSKRLAR